MSKEIIVNVGERETRIAVLEENKLVELHIERSERVVGGIYKCRVANVLQGMDAAFVDIGLERNAFLYVGDVLPTGDDSSDGADSGRRNDRGGNVPRRQASANSSTAPARTELTGENEPEDLALASTVDLISAMGIEVDDDDEDEDEDEEGASDSSGAASSARKTRPGYRRSSLRQQRIKDVLKIGMEKLVQVIKGPRGTKGARVSTRISLPGRYLVLMPEADNLGVSRKIEDSKERDRLKKIGDRIRVQGFGLIIRTEAEEKTEVELKQDMDFLVQTWRQIQETNKRVAAPYLVQQDLTLLYKTIRDVFGSDVSKLIIDDPAEYEKANELLDRISPKLKGRIHLYDGPKPIFDEYNLEQELDRLTKRKVFLKSGGSLVIDETEALTVIDVNTSKFTGGSNLNETIAKTNVDAANETARQMRLRDIGGIIVIDFIDMNNPRDKQAVIKTLELALKKDRSRTKISNISPLGLVEMTRKRTGETLTGFMTEECVYCKGRGHIPSSESVSITLERELRRVVNDPKNAKKDAFMVMCNPEVAELLIGAEGETIAELERQLQRALYIRANEDYHIERFNIEAGELADYEKLRQSFKRAQIVECVISKSMLKEPNKHIGWSDGYLVDFENGNRPIGSKTKVKILDPRRSYASALIVSGNARD